MTLGCVVVVVRVCVCEVNGRSLVLILIMHPACTEVVSLCRAAWQTPGKPAYIDRPKVASRRVEARPTAQRHLRNPATSVSLNSADSNLNASKSNCCHLSQIKEDTGEPSVSAYLEI